MPTENDVVSDDDPEGFAADWALLRHKIPKTYIGRRTKTDKCEVKVMDGETVRKLPLCRNLFKHSHGFEWGYTGSGPAQLALAILMDYLGDPNEAVRLHQKFKGAVVSNLPKEGWALPESVVREAVKLIDTPENS